MDFDDLKAAVAAKADGLGIADGKIPDTCMRLMGLGARSNNGVWTVGSKNLSLDNAISSLRKLAPDNFVGGSTDDNLNIPGRPLRKPLDRLERVNVETERRIRRELEAKRKASS